MAVPGSINLGRVTTANEEVLLSLVERPLAKAENVRPRPSARPRYLGLLTGFFNQVNNIVASVDVFLCGQVSNVGIRMGIASGGVVEIGMSIRLNVQSFHDLIEYGVKVDGHPAGVQVFLWYWINWFGTDPGIVKLPFVLLGICSVYLMYYLGKSLFNESCGLISSALMAGLQYPVIYSLSARPYAFGLFFILCTAIFYFTGEA